MVHYRYYCKLNYSSNIYGDDEIRFVTNIKSESECNSSTTDSSNTTTTDNTNSGSDNSSSGTDNQTPPPTIDTSSTSTSDTTNSINTTLLMILDQITKV